MASSPEGTWGLEDLEDNKTLLGRRRIRSSRKNTNIPEGLEDEELFISGFFLGGC